MVLSRDAGKPATAVSRALRTLVRPKTPLSAAARAHHNTIAPTTSPSSTSRHVGRARRSRPQTFLRCRRAHTTVLYQNKICVFSGGNGLQALNEVWTLDVGSSLDRTRWDRSPYRGRKRCLPRGYRTANLVQNFMIVVWR